MSHPPFQADALSALDSARNKVQSLMPRIQSLRGSITWKEDGSPVTEADVLVERELADHLARVLPGSRLIGEETYSAGDDDDLAGWLAVLDPIDGTENFCSGMMEWGVSLSLWRDGTHQASMLLMPELNACLRSGDAVARHGSRIVGLSSSLPPETVAEAAGEAEVRVMGCAVYNLYNVARGAYRRFFNPRGARSWDILAGLAIAREQGCAVTVEGAPYDGQYLPASGRYRFDIRN
jgi:myo-inositol-1(or 4)-monophosphatase